MSYRTPHTRRETWRLLFLYFISNALNILRGENKINEKTVWIVKPFVGYVYMRTVSCSFTNGKVIDYILFAEMFCYCMQL